MDNQQVRDESPDDADAIDGVLSRAFGSTAEAHLVRSLRHAGHIRFALVATVERSVVGHIAMSPLRIVAPDGESAALALAPLAVDPPHQRRGIGAALVRATLDRARTLGESLVFVLGDPAYYGRFGFTAKLARPFECAYACDAFQALSLGGESVPSSGRIIYSPPFDELPTDDGPTR